MFALFSNIPTVNAETSFGYTVEGGSHAELLNNFVYLVNATLLDDSVVVTKIRVYANASSDSAKAKLCIYDSSGNWMGNSSEVTFTQALAWQEFTVYISLDNAGVYLLGIQPAVSNTISVWYDYTANCSPYFSHTYAEPLPDPASLEDPLGYKRSMYAVKEQDLSSMTLHTDGRYIKDVNDSVVTLYGAWKAVGLSDGCVNMFSPEGTEYLTYSGWRTWSNESCNAVLDQMLAWGFNSFAEFIHADWWIYDAKTLLGSTPQYNEETNQNYTTTIKYMLELARDKGLYVQLRMYDVEAWTSDGGEGRVTYPYPNGTYTHNGDIFPNRAEYAEFWYNITKVLGVYDNVIFNLYDEPLISNRTEWFVAVDEAITQIRLAESEEGYNSHLVMVNWAYCGDCAWMLDYINGDYETTNVVFSNHIYRDAGTFENNATCRTDYEYISDQITNVLGYKNVTDAGYPVMVTAIGAHYGYQEDDYYEYFINSLVTLNELEIGYWGYTWYIPEGAPAELGWGLLTNSTSRNTTYANRIGQALIDGIAGTLTSVNTTLLITNPQNTTYSSGSISVQLSASGGTIDSIWFNCKNGSEWIYGNNQTYSSPTSMTGFVNGTYVFYGWANNTEGSLDSGTVSFTVAIPPPPPPPTSEPPSTGSNLTVKFNVYMLSEPLENCLITIYKVYDRVVAEAKTDRRGSVKFTLPSGNYRYVANYEDYVKEGTFKLDEYESIRVDFDKLRVPFRSMILRLIVGLCVVAAAIIAISKVKKH